MSEHTPGPWMAKETPAGKGKVVDRHGFSICNTTAGPYSQQLIDARLIAAAPDLLQALILARDTARGFMHKHGPDTESLPEIDAAIAKATSA